MNNTDSPSSTDRTGLTATITGLLVSISTFFSADMSIESKTIIPVIAGIISPFISAGISRLQRKVEQPPELTDFLAAYESDLKFTMGRIKDKTTPQATRVQLEQKYSDTVLMMATAHQDFRSKSLGITTATTPD